MPNIKLSKDCGPQLAFFVGRKAYTTKGPATRALAKRLASRVSWTLRNARNKMGMTPLTWPEQYKMEKRLYKRAVPYASMYVAKWLRK